MKKIGLISFLKPKKWILARAKLLMLGMLVAIFIPYACAQSRGASFEYLNHIPISGKDPANKIDSVRELGWSPSSLAFSADGKRIAFTADSSRPFGVVDIESKKITPIQSQFKGPGTVHWSKRLNRLALVQDTEVSVFDMSGLLPKLLYTIENKMPNLLSAVSSSLVSVGEADYLMLAGVTSWRLDSSNANIVIYDFKTGERKLTYQFFNPPFDNQDGKGHVSTSVLAAVAAVTKDQSILVAVSTQKGKYVVEDGIRRVTMLRSLQVVNMTTNRSQCDIEIQQYRVVNGVLYSFGNPYLSILSTGKLLLRDQYRHDIYDMQTCEREHQLETQLHQPLIDFDKINGPRGKFAPPEWLATHKPPVLQTFTSPDDRWVFGTSYWAPKRSKAPFRIWQTTDWALIRDDVYDDDGSVTTAAFSQDGNYLAFGTANRITFYKLHIR